MWTHDIPLDLLYSQRRRHLVAMVCCSQSFQRFLLPQQQQQQRVRPWAHRLALENGSDFEFDAAFLTVETTSFQINDADLFQCRLSVVLVVVR